LWEYKAVYFSLEEILAFEVIYFLTLQDLTVIYCFSSDFCSELWFTIFPDCGPVLSLFHQHN